MFRSAALHGSGDLRGRDAHAIPFGEHLIGGGWQAVDPDQEVLGLAAGDLLLEQLQHGGTSMWSANPPPSLLMNKIFMTLLL